MSHVSRGNAAENFVAEQLELEGWTVGSRRHRKGGGDLLAHNPDGREWLIEVKARPRKTVYSGFTRTQRSEVVETPMAPHAERWLARVQGSGEKRSIEWIAESRWPTRR